MQAVTYKASNIFKVIWCFLMSLSLTAMVASGSTKEHLSLAYNSPFHEAATLITDRNLGFTQSGVLVRDNIVITAAHGMQLLLNAKYPMKDLGSYVLITPKQLTVTFSISLNHDATYNVEYVLLDSRYIRFEPGDQHKFDIAILKLSQPVYDITPVSIEAELVLEPDAPMLVITWGNADMPSKKLKRGFCLYEWSLFFPNLDEDALANYRTVMLSSIFFEPADQLPKETPGVNEPESVQRRYFALKSWMNDKRPYGLALPGTSGAPVFVETRILGKREFHLFGLVMGYATLGEEMVLLSKNNEDFAKDPRNAYNKYQTIITTPFRLNMQPSANTTNNKHFAIEARYLKMIDGLSSGAIN
jgi:hypothetical protein